MNQQIGNPSRIVKIGDSIFSKYELIRGIRVESKLIFRRVERGLRMCFFMPLNGNIRTLCIKLLNHGTKICSDLEASRLPCE